MSLKFLGVMAIILGPASSHRPSLICHFYSASFHFASTILLGSYTPVSVPHSLFRLTNMTGQQTDQHEGRLNPPTRTFTRPTNMKHVGHATSPVLHHAYVCYALDTCGAKSLALFLSISDCRDLCLITQTNVTSCCILFSYKSQARHQQ